MDFFLAALSSSCSSGCWKRRAAISKDGNRQEGEAAPNAWALLSPWRTEYKPRCCQAQCPQMHLPSSPSHRRRRIPRTAPSGGVWAAPQRGASESPRSCPVCLATEGSGSSSEEVVAPTEIGLLHGFAVVQHLPGIRFAAGARWPRPLPGPSDTKQWLFNTGTAQTAAPPPPHPHWDRDPRPKPWEELTVQGSTLCSSLRQPSGFPTPEAPSPAPGGFLFSGIC